MMTSAAVLIAAVLLLGGLLAVLGDRLGSKVGKARLRLFGLRPRQTATVVSILTGTVIAASTLGVLFALSKSLRQGVFKLDEILTQQREAEAELNQAKMSRVDVERALVQVTQEKTQAEQGLVKSQELFSRKNQQLNRLNQAVKGLRTERQQIVGQKNKLLQQRGQLLERIPELKSLVRVREEELDRRQTRLQELRAQRQELQAELNDRDRLVNDRDRAIAQLDEAIDKRDRAIREKAAELDRLEQQFNVLRQRTKLLAQDYQGLREGTVAIARGQVLSFAAFRVVNANAAREAIETLLREANRAAISATQPDSLSASERVVQIPLSQVEQSIEKISDGQNYVVRILAIGNFVEGEKPIFGAIDIAPNQKIFRVGEAIATLPIEPFTTTPEQMQERLDLLLASCQFRARRGGLLGEIQVEEGRIFTLTRFIERMIAAPQSFDRIQAIALENTYTAGPLKLRLVAWQKGKVAFTT